MKDEPDWVRRIRERSALTQRRLGDELRKLMESPDSLAIATALLDAYLSGLNFLSNYPAALDCYGQAVDMVDIREQLESDARKEFLRLTGERYVYPAARDYAFRTEGPKT